jgi:Gpi18-like mannosyltransferase
MICLWKNNSPAMILFASAAMVLGFFMLPTQMHERYMYPIFIFLAALLFAVKSAKFCYGILSATFLLNLVRVLPYSGNLFLFKWLNYFNEIPHEIMIISIINFLVFIYLGIILLSQSGILSNSRILEKIFKS